MQPSILPRLLRKFLLGRCIDCTGRDTLHGEFSELMDMAGVRRAATKTGWLTAVRASPIFSGHGPVVSGQSRSPGWGQEQAPGARLRPILKQLGKSETPSLQQYRIWNAFVVSTLAEIEAAVELPPPNEKEQLLRFIAARLRDETATPYQQVELSRSSRGFPISKGRVRFTSADVPRMESEPHAIG